MSIRNKLAALSQLSLRMKLLTSFLSLAMLIAISGGAGLLFMFSLKGSVSTLADVSTPILSDSTAISVGLRV